MSVVVQTTYRPTIEKAAVGMVADESNSGINTFIVETAAGIPFGVAVSKGANAKGCVVGGNSFLGVSVRDVTLSLDQVDPLSDTPNTLDYYGLEANLAALTKGHVWVEAANAVTKGNNVYFDYVSGALGNTASGTSATGYIDFTSNPVVDETLVINGSTVTFKATTSVGSLQTAVHGTLGDTIVELAKTLNASSDGGIDVLTYLAWPVSPGGSGQGSGAYRLMMSADTAGTTANSYALDASGTDGATASGSTLSGGYAGALASGAIHFSSQSADNSTITLNGTVVTLHDGTGGSVDRGASLAAEVDNLVTALTASVDAQISKCTYTATGVPHDTLVITSKTTGLTMNSFTLAASTSPASHGTVTAMSGGIPVPSQIVGGMWLTTAIAGNIAKVSLGIQR